MLLVWVCWAIAGASEPTRPVAGSAEFVDAVASLFARGLDDPAKGAFCEADIVVEDLLRLRSVKGRATGWIIRARADGTGDFLGWNGLIYKADRIGPAKDLADYVEKWASHPPRRSRVAELDSASDPRTALGIAFLVRLGRKELAESSAQRLRFRVALLIERLACDVVSFRFDRALALISAGRDELAYRDLAWVVANDDLLFRFVRYVWRPLPEKLIHAPYLAAIAKARAERPKRRPFSLEENRRLPTQARVAQIIEYLDDARFTLTGKSPWLRWSKADVCRAAFEVGRPALGALIACVRSDDRYTRGVMVSPPFNSLPVIGASDLAMRLALKIGRFRSAPADIQSDKEWESAMYRRPLLPTLAEELVRGMSPEDASGEFRRLRARGDTATLRQLADVAERRATSDLTYGRLDDDRRSRLERATRWALILAELEGDRSRWLLDALSWRLIRSIDGAQTQGDRNLSVCMGCLGKILAKRLELGDERATADFERTVASRLPWFWSADVERLRALTVRPDWGAGMAKSMFLGPNAIWNIAKLAREENVDLLACILGSDLLKLPAVRTSLSEALEDKAVVGICWSDKFGYFLADLASTDRGYGSGSDVFLPSDPRDPEPDVRSEVRACDLVAFDLSLLRGAPRFRPYWSMADRDAVIKEMAAFVRRNGESLADRRPTSRPYRHEECLWREPPFPAF